MKKIEFTKELLVGVDLIDEEHKKFFDYVNAALAALEGTDDEATATAKALFQKLLDYASSHLAHEEEYMQKNHDAELVRQIQEHQAFRKKVAELTSKKELSRSDLEATVSYMVKWLYSHIVTSDTMIGKKHTHGRFVMTKDFLTGIEIVDEEHRVLFDIIGRAHDILHDDMAFDKYDLIAGVLTELKDYTIRHFADEEEYMASINYDGLPAQKAVHHAFIEKVVHINLDELESMDENQNGYLSDLLDFLNDWLINHILKMDKLIPAK